MFFVIILFSIGVIDEAVAQISKPIGQVYQYDENIYIVHHNGHHLVGSEGESLYSATSVIYGDVVNISDETLYYIIVRGSVYKEEKLWEDTGHRQDLTFRHDYKIGQGKPVELAASPFKMSLKPGESAPFILFPGQTGFDCYELWIESYEREKPSVGISDEILRNDLVILDVELNNKGTLTGLVHNPTSNILKHTFAIIAEYDSDDKIFAIKGESLGTMSPDAMSRFTMQVYTPGYPSKNTTEKWLHDKPENYEILAWGYTSDKSETKTTQGYPGSVIHLGNSLYYPDKKLAYYMDLDEIREQAAIDLTKEPNPKFCSNEEREFQLKGSISPDIPSWIKNNAKWWVEDTITENEFIKAIEYLAKNNIIRVSAEIDKTHFELNNDKFYTTRHTTDILILSGWHLNQKWDESAGTYVSDELGIYGFQEKINCSMNVPDEQFPNRFEMVRSNDGGKFETMMEISNNWNEGKYDFTCGISGEQLISMSFEVIYDEKPEEIEIKTKNKIPSWIKNNAKWWVEDAITDDEFIKAIEYLVEKKIIDLGKYN